MAGDSAPVQCYRAGAIYNSSTGGIRLDGLGDGWAISVMGNSAGHVNFDRAIAGGSFFTSGPIEVGWVLDDAMRESFNAGEILPAGLSSELSDYFIQMGRIGESPVTIPILSDSGAYLPNWTPFATGPPATAPIQPPVNDLPLHDVALSPTNPAPTLPEELRRELERVGFVGPTDPSPMDVESPMTQPDPPFCRSPTRRQASSQPSHLSGLAWTPSGNTHLKYRFVNS